MFVNFVASLLAMAALLGSFLDGSSATNPILTSASKTTSQDLEKSLKMRRDTPSSKVHIVTVGKGNFMYEPNNLTANVGDIVSFQFYPTNHSVNQGVYCGDSEGGCNPCIPIGLVDNGTIGFSSQNFLTAQDANPQNLNFQTYNLTINDTNPIWFYCTAIGSCIVDGMVGVINGAKNQNVSRQIASAQMAPFQLSPGQSLPEPSPVNSSNHSSLSGGKIAGISIGVVAFVAIGCALFYYFGIIRARKAAQQKQPMSQPEATSPFQSTYTPSAQHASYQGPWPWSPVLQMSPNQPGQTFEGQFHHHSYPPDMHGQFHGQGTFLGYNPVTGIAEFAQEAPNDNEVMLAGGTSPSLDKKIGPGSQDMNQGHGEQTMHELPGEQLEAAEVGPYR